MDRRRPELQPRTRTLWEQLSTPDPAIRDFLKTPHDDEGGGGADAERRPCALMDAIGRESRGESDRRPCTLMDAIGRDVRGESGGCMINWKPRLRDRLRLRRDANALSITTSNRRADEYGGEEEEEESKDEAPTAASMPLMALLEQTDTESDDDDKDEEEDSGASASDNGALVGGEEDDGEGRGQEEEMSRACCVCMARHKGAAFIPCGHTFCRPCSRELWLTRADCPLCNSFIHDILHIF